MKKSLEKRIERYCDESEFPFAVYFTKLVPNALYKNKKYFFLYHETNKVQASFRTQREIELFLEERGY